MKPPVLETRLPSKLSLLAKTHGEHDNPMPTVDDGGSSLSHHDDDGSFVSTCDMLYYYDALHSEPCF